MNKKELLDKAVTQFGGKWPALCDNNVYMSHRPKIKHTTYYPFYVTGYKNDDYIYWHISEFEKRARELGYINGYRWGVEYPTNGKKPDLPDGVVFKVDGYSYNRVSKWFWSKVESFRITDERYKPADTGYLNACTVEHLAHTKTTDTTIEFDSVKTDGEFAFDPVPQDENWFDYDNQEMRKPPKANTEVEMLWGGVYQCRVEYVGVYGFKAVFYRFDTHEIDNAESPTVTFRPLDWNRKAEAERKRVVDAAVAIVVDANITEDVLGFLYDLGYLRMPPEKN